MRPPRAATSPTVGGARPLLATQVERPRSRASRVLATPRRARAYKPSPSVARARTVDEVRGSARQRSSTSRRAGMPGDRRAQRGRGARCTARRPPALAAAAGHAPVYAVGERLARRLAAAAAATQLRRAHLVATRSARARTATRRRTSSGARVRGRAGRGPSREAHAWEVFRAGPSRSATTRATIGAPGPRPRHRGRTGSTRGDSRPPTPRARRGRRRGWSGRA